MTYFLRKQFMLNRLIYTLVSKYKLHQEVSKKLTFDLSNSNESSDGQDHDLIAKEYQIDLQNLTARREALPREKVDVSIGQVTYLHDENKLTEAKPRPRKRVKFDI